ncbi:MAG: stage V sporulation protein D, partial [Clostridia bacterium]|nr:stage V sporulation protein D [Clostridia bacterium]
MSAARRVYPSDYHTRSRITALLAAVCLLFVALVGRLWWLQVHKSNWLIAKAQDQWTREMTINPWRGAILDRNGKPLAQSVLCETVVLHPRLLKDAGNADVVADTLAPVLGLNRNYILERATYDGKTEQRYLKRQITREEADAIRKLNYKGVGLVPDRKRVYPSRKLLGRVLGYTNVDGDGQDGLELYYNKYLKGKSGTLSSEVTASRETLPFGSEYIEAPIPGQTVRLTVDEVMQSFCE